MPTWGHFACRFRTGACSWRVRSAAAGLGLETTTILVVVAARTREVCVISSVVLGGAGVVLGVRVAAVPREGPTPGGYDVQDCRTVSNVTRAVTTAQPLR